MNGLTFAVARRPAKRRRLFTWPTGVVPILEARHRPERGNIALLLQPQPLSAITWPDRDEPRDGEEFPVLEQLSSLDLTQFRVFDDADDDPVLLHLDGTPVDTWRQGYPYSERMDREDYERVKRLLQIELLKLQEWIKDTGERLVIVFEGRDAAGKGGTIKRFMEHLNPRGARVVALEKPTPVEQGQWYFQRYVQHLPTRGEMVLFDRSWYNRAGVERVMGFCTADEHAEFLRQ